MITRKFMEIIYKFVDNDSAGRLAIHIKLKFSLGNSPDSNDLRMIFCISL